MFKKIVLLHLWAKPKSSYIFFCTQILFHWIRSRAWEDCEDVHDVEHLLLEGETGTELPGCWHSWQGELGGDDKICLLNLKIFIPGCRFFLEFFQDPLHSHCPPLKHEAIFLISIIISSSKSSIFCYNSYFSIFLSISAYLNIFSNSLYYSIFS